MIKHNLRAGLIGLGMMGRNHLRVLSSLPGVDFVGTVENHKSISSNQQNGKILRNISELIKMKIDYAVVAVPTIFHLEVCRELAESGIHTLVEKPLAQDFETSTALSACFSSSNLIAAVGHIERYNPAVIEARRRIGDLGTIYQIATRRQGPFPSRVSDIGVIKDLATHDIDTVMWLTSQRYSNISAQALRKDKHAYEDLVAATGKLFDGTIVNHLVNWISPSKERVTIISGEHGTLLVDTLTSDLTLYATGSIDSTWQQMANLRGSTEGRVTRFAIPKHEPLRTEHENFRDAVLGKPADIVTLEQGRLNVIVAEAIEASSQSNQFVEITY